MGSRTTKAPDPPETLSEAGKSRWLALVGDYGDSVGRRLVLAAALGALDRAELAGAVVASAGLTTTTGKSKVLHVHPAVKVEREARAQFLAAAALLGFQNKRF